MMTAVWVFIVMLALFLLYCVRTMAENAITLRKILEEALDDRKARDQAVAEMKVTADSLAAKTKEAVEQSDQYLLALSQKIDHNTEISTRAAEASAEAAHVANSMNEKIMQTNLKINNVTKEGA